MGPATIHCKLLSSNQHLKHNTRERGMSFQKCDQKLGKLRRHQTAIFEMCFPCSLISCKRQTIFAPLIPELSVEPESWRRRKGKPAPTSEIQSDCRLVSPCKSPSSKWGSLKREKLKNDPREGNNWRDSRLSFCVTRHVFKERDAARARWTLLSGGRDSYPVVLTVRRRPFYVIG